MYDSPDPQPAKARGRPDAPESGTRIVMKAAAAAPSRFDLVPWLYGGALCLTALILLVIVGRPLRDEAPGRQESMRTYIEPTDRFANAQDLAPQLARLQLRLDAIEQERNRLAERLGNVESMVGDITGSISRDKLSPTPPAAPMPVAVPVSVPAVDSTALAIDIGGFRSLAAMRARLAELRKARPDFARLSGRAFLVDTARETAEARLAIGPFAAPRDMIEACGQLKALGVMQCPAVPFEGQPVELQ